MYAKILGLRHLRPTKLERFLLVEGSLAVSTLLALAEFVHWSKILIIPMVLAAVIKAADSFGPQAMYRGQHRLLRQSLLVLLAELDAAMFRRLARRQGRRPNKPTGSTLARLRVAKEVRTWLDSCPTVDLRRHVEGPPISLDRTPEW